jgi:hypothetical protein
LTPLNYISTEVEGIDDDVRTIYLPFKVAVTDGAVETGALEMNL